MSKMKLALNVVQDLRNLADSLEALAGAAMGESPAAPTEPQQTTTESPKHTTGDDPAAQFDPTPDASEPTKLTLVELRAFVAGKSTLENRPRIKAILDRFGVKKLTGLSEDQYPALMREVEAL
jgi:hypothetical protein